MVTSSVFISAVFSPSGRSSRVRGRPGRSPGHHAVLRPASTRGGRALCRRRGCSPPCRASWHRPPGGEGAASQALWQDCAVGNGESAKLAESWGAVGSQQDVGHRQEAHYPYPARAGRVVDKAFGSSWCQGSSGAIG